MTDPFGRFAVLGYDQAGRLQSITDAAGMTSSFTYGASDFITSLTTPYGTTSFRHEARYIDNPRIEATDPVGATERLEFHYINTAIAASDPSNVVPTGFTNANGSLHQYNSLYWDKLSMARHPRGDDPTKAVIIGWMWFKDPAEHHALSHTVPHSVKPSVDTSNPAIDRRFKTGHFRRPTETDAVLLRELLSAQVGMDFRAPAPWPTFEHMCVM